jgi:hypothetical protein
MIRKESLGKAQFRESIACGDGATGLCPSEMGVFGIVRHARSSGEKRAVDKSGTREGLGELFGIGEED